MNHKKELLRSLWVGPRTFCFLRGSDPVQGLGCRAGGFGSYRGLSDVDPQREHPRTLGENIGKS